jgi:hypothetical protein
MTGGPLPVRERRAPGDLLDGAGHLGGDPDPSSEHPEQAIGHVWWQTARPAEVPGGLLLDAQRPAEGLGEELDPFGLG